MTTRSCPRCGNPRDADRRHCATCGLDFWAEAQSDAASALPPAPVAEPPARRSSAFSRSVLVLGSLLAALAVGGFVFLRLSSTSGLAGASGASPSSAPMTVDQRVVAAFLDTAVREDASFHVTTTASVVVAGEGQTAVIRVDGDMDTAGPDWAGRYSVDLNGVPVDADMVRKDDVGYVRPVGAAEWQQIPDDPEMAQPINPFLTLTGPEDVEYVGAETRDGASLHHLRISKWIGGDLEGIPGASDLEVADSSFDVYVTEAGVPLSGIFTGRLVGDAEGTSMVIEMDADYRFSEWGAPITIEAPAP